MTPPTDADPIAVDLPRAEQWLVHHVMLDTLGLARMDTQPNDDPSERAVRIVRKLEAGRRGFTRSELELVRNACAAYARRPEAAAADRDLANEVIDRVTAALGETDRHRPRSIG